MERGNLINQRQPDHVPSQRNRGNRTPCLTSLTVKPAFFSASVGAAAISRREAVAAVGLAALLRMHACVVVRVVGGKAAPKGDLNV